MKTLGEAAAAYCEQREALAALEGRIREAGRCEVYETGSDAPDFDPGVSRCTDSIDTDWWRATPEQVADFCPPCQAKVPLWHERHAMKARLSGLMRSMREAYRRERAK